METPPPPPQAQAVIEAAPATFKMALYTPPHLAMCAVDAVHAGTGMPYWMTIVAITLAMRTAILPVAVVSSRNAARSAAMKPEMDLLQAAIEVGHTIFLWSACCWVSHRYISQEQAHKNVSTYSYTALYTPL